MGGPPTSFVGPGAYYGGKGGGGGGSAQPAPAGGRPGDWNCPSCKAVVFGSRVACFKCGTGKDGKKVPEGAKGMGKGMMTPAPEKFSDAAWEKPRTETGLRLLSELASGAAWRYVQADEGRRSYVAYLPNPFTRDQTSTFYQECKDQTKWLQPSSPSGIPIPRKTAWMVANTCQCSYRYGSIEVDHVTYPPWMLSLMQLVMPHCGLATPDTWPTSCNLNLYEDGGMSVGWHSDDERLFQGKFQDVRIISLSLGAARKFEVRTNWPEAGEKGFNEVVLGDGDLCTMEGMFQKHFQHRVPKEGGVRGARINLTWRWVVKHAPRCPASRMR